MSDAEHACAECELATELAEARMELNVAASLLKRLLASFQDGTFDVPDVARAAEEEVLAFLGEIDQP